MLYSPAGFAIFLWASQGRQWFLARRIPQQQAEASLSTVCVLGTFTKPLAMVAIIWCRVLEHTASDGSLLSSRGEKGWVFNTPKPWLGLWERHLPTSISWAEGRSRVVHRRQASAVLFPWPIDWVQKLGITLWTSQHMDDGCEIGVNLSTGWQIHLWVTSRVVFFFFLAGASLIDFQRFFASLTSKLDGRES